MLYVCSGYPACDSYVGVHEGTKRPKGSLANSGLRNKRIRAHRAIDSLVKNGYMSKNEVYAWLSCRLNLPPEETHSGYFFGLSVRTGNPFYAAFFLSQFFNTRSHSRVACPHR